MYGVDEASLPTEEERSSYSHLEVGSSNLYTKGILQPTI